MHPIGGLRRAIGYPFVAVYLFLLAFAGVAGVAPADAAKPLRGVALVIGQGRYEHLPALASPANDADTVAKLLERLGFTVSTATDRNARKLRRDLANFADDAQGADVAVIYYSGHGIEAGGENWLVPVDADLAAPGDADHALVPLSDMLDAVRAAVPLTILFLDACRTSPFPPGTVLQTGGESLPIGPAGLAATKGATALEPKGTDGETDGGLGSVIGFAAAPGAAALDGPAGGNSPYAAALARHLSASTGAEFGTVMRMVTEEVYLKTRGRQRPWVNETLTKLLYFGGATEQPGGEEGGILAERRQLLLSIASLPEPERVRVETAAKAADVPMDGLYAMLKALGANRPDSPAEMDLLLRNQAERLKAILAERDALSSTDPEVVRLMALSERAFTDGALQAARDYLNRAKARIADLSRTVDAAEAQLRARRLEFAEVFRKSAELAELAFDYAGASRDYVSAFHEVERWDAPVAADYKAESTAVLLRGLELLERNADRQKVVDKVALEVLGETDLQTSQLRAAVMTKMMAQPILAEWSGDTTREDWAATEFRLAFRLQAASEQLGFLEGVEQALSAYELILAASEGRKASDADAIDMRQVRSSLSSAKDFLARHAASPDNP